MWSLTKKGTFHALRDFVPKWPASITRSKFQAANRAGQIANKAHALKIPLSLGSWDMNKTMSHVLCIPGIPRDSGMFHMCTKAAQRVPTSKPHDPPTSWPTCFLTDAETRNEAVTTILHVRAQILLASSSCLEKNEIKKNLRPYY